MTLHMILESLKVMFELLEACHVASGQLFEWLMGMRRMCLLYLTWQQIKGAHGKVLSSFFEGLVILAEIL